MIATLLLGCLLAQQDDPQITVPDSFIVERIAASPLIERPIMAGFDDQGRLYVGDSAGVNLKFDDLLKTPPHRIIRLESTKGDGVFDKSVVFADKMTFPMGALWYRGSLYVCAPPSVWKLTDTDGDGVADKREEIVTRFGSNGNAADIHGPFLGPDGWFYWTDGRHGHRIDQPDGSRSEGNAARVFRSRPDGTQVEVVCGGGMDNPVEIAFTEEGEPLVTCALFQASPKRVDVIFHAIEGGVFPYHESLREFKRTGDLLPSVVDVGWVAPSGLMRYRSAAFGKEYTNNFFTAQFNTHKVQRHIIERDGATFRGRNEEFLISANPDFHPTDVLEDADGSLIVIDTGGWFRIGCPTSRIDKPQIKGGLYRIRKKDAPKVEDPHGLKIAWDKASTELLDDPRFAVRDRAIETCADPAALRAASARTRLNGVWALSRRGAPVRDALADKDASVRLAAAHVSGQNLDRRAQPDLLKLLKDETVAVRREAATALGRLRDKSAVPALLDAIRAGGDRFLEHALIYALIRIDDREGTLAGLADSNPSVRRAALIALDQMDHGALTRDQVTPLLDPSNLPLQQAALSIVAARGWSDELLGLLRDWLAAEQPNPETCAILTAFAKDPVIQDLVAQGLRSPKTPTATRLILLETVARAPLDHPPATWTAELRWALDHADERVVRQAVAAVRATGVADFDAAVGAIAKDTSRSEDLRVEALVVIVPRLAKLESALFGFLRECVDKEKPVLLRLAAAQALGSASLSDDQLYRLASTVGVVGALEPAPHRRLRALRQFEGRAGARLLAGEIARRGIAAGRSPAPHAEELSRRGAGEGRGPAEAPRRRHGEAEGAARGAGAGPDGRRSGPRPRDLLRQESRLLDLPRDPVAGWPRRSRSFEDRGDPHGPRPARGNRLPQRELCARLRALPDPHEGRRDPRRSDRPRDGGCGVPVHGRPQRKARAARIDRPAADGQDLDHAPGPGRPALARRVPRPARVPGLAQVAPQC
jgi:putative membrane-bound dehydrogenase-like protein